MDVEMYNHGSQHSRSLTHACQSLLGAGCDLQKWDRTRQNGQPCPRTSF